MRIIECAFCGDETDDLYRCFLCGEYFCPDCGVMVTMRLLPMCMVCMDDIMSDADVLTGDDYDPVEVAYGASR